MQTLGLETVRNQAATMEVESRRFYEKAAARAQDPHIRQLLDDLAQEERTHENRAEELEEEKLERRRQAAGRRSQPPTVRAADRAAGSGGINGRFGIDAGAGIRGGVRDA